MDLIARAAKGLSQLSARFASRLDRQEAASSFQGDMARDEFFLPQLIGTQERSLFPAAQQPKEPRHVRID